MTSFDDDRLSTVLASVGEHLVTAAPAPVRRAPKLPTRIGVAVAAAMVVIVVVVLAVAPLRSAVARWFGIGSTQIQVDAQASVAAASLPSIDAGADPVSANDAAALLSEPLPRLDRTELGPPAGLARMPEGGVLAVWPDGTTLWLHDADPTSEQLFSKLVDTVEDVTVVDGLGEQALAIAGSHVLRTPHREVGADAVVLWRSGGLELRLEADRTPTELVELARDFESSR